MNDLQEIGDLRPAPRTTPTLVLWMMMLVLFGGAALLAWTLPWALVGPTAVAVRLRSESAPKPSSSTPSHGAAASAAHRASSGD